MSRIGTKPIIIPENVTVKINDNTLTVSGKLGVLSYSLLPGITVVKEDSVLKVHRADDERKSKAFHGLTRALISNMVTGVSEGYSKVLEVNGTGYSAEQTGSWLKLVVGYSHEIFMEIPEHLEIETEAIPRARSGKLNTQAIITVKGISKEDVGKFAAEIRKCRPPENYKGKGIRYKDENVKIKAGKTGAK